MSGICPVATRSGINSGKSAVVVLKNLPSGIPEGHQTDDPRELPRANFSRQPLRTFHCFSDFWIKTVKNMRPRFALGLTLNIFK